MKTYRSNVYLSVDNKGVKRKMRVVRPLGKTSLTGCFTNDSQMSHKCHRKALINLSKGVLKLFHRGSMSEIIHPILSHRCPRDATVQFQTRGIQGKSNILQVFTTVSLTCTVGSCRLQQLISAQRVAYSRAQFKAKQKDKHLIL